MKLSVLNYVRKEGSQINQIICALIINFPLVAYGACVGWMSPMTLVLQSDQSPRGSPFTDEEISWMASTPSIVAIPAVVFFGYVVDTFGRKTASLLCSVQFVGCWMIKLASPEIAALVAARALVGAGMAGCYVVTPLYVKEISEDRIRGALATLVILSQTVGNLLLYVVGDALSYRATLWFCLALPVAHLLLSVAMPETPAYLFRQGKTQEANRVIAWLRCREENDPVIQHELNLLDKEHQQENSKFALKVILTDKILSRAFRITVLLALSREVCGTLPVLYFASNIFEMTTEGGSQFKLTPNQQTMVLGGLQVIGAAVATSLVEKCGRKPLLFVTSLISGLGMCLLAMWFLLRNLDIFIPGWIPLTALCVCIFSDASGLQPISLVVRSEMFSFKYRSTVNAVSESLSYVLGFLQLRFFKPVSSALGIHVSFFFFGAVCLANAVYVIFVVPETKMRTINEIYEDIMTEKERDEYRIKNVKSNNISFKP